MYVRNRPSCDECNDAMNHVEVNCVMKRDVYPQNTHLYSKNICVVLFFVLKISMVYQEKNISQVLLYGYSGC